MTKKHIAQRRQEAAARAVQRRWRQEYINERLERPGKMEGIYKKPTLVVRVIRSDD
jgi:hypothetical protein